jgi:hypothetical protein
MVPTWLHILAIAMLGIGIATAIGIAIDEFRHPRTMAIMNVVWPIAALFGTVIVAAAYLASGVRPDAAMTRRRRLRSASARRQRCERPTTSRTD